MQYIDEVALIVGIIVALLGLYWQGVKARAEVAKARAEIAKINHEMSPNSGKSIHDLVTATSSRVKELAQSVGGIREDMRDERRHVAAIVEDNNDRLGEIRARLTELEHQSREKENKQ